MRQSMQGVRAKAGALSASFLVLCCSGHKNLGADATSTNPPNVDTSTGGKGSMPSEGTAGVDSPTSGGTKATDGASGSGDEPVITADAGAPGAGGQGVTTTPGYDFFVVPGAAPTGLDLKLLSQGARADSFSADGSLLAGGSWWQLFSNGETPSGGGEAPFLWTRGTGTVTFPNVSGKLLAAKGGGAVFGVTTPVAGLQQLMRWTPAGGVELFDISIPATLTAAYVTSCSFDGSAAIVEVFPTAASPTAMLWRAGQSGNQLEKPARTPSGFSDDGSALFAFEAESPAVQHLFRAPIAPGPLVFEEIKQPTGYTDCVARLPSTTINRDGSIVVGACGQHADSPVMFRWQKGDPAMRLVMDGPANPQVMTPDGTSVLGAGMFGDHASPFGLPGLTWWTATGVQHVPQAGAVVGVSDDGSTAWVFALADDPLKNALRWPRGKGLVPLAGAAGASLNRLNAVSPDGTLAVGYSELPAPGRATNPRHTMVWDIHGARDITAELSAAGFDQRGVDTQELNDFLEPGRIWSGSSIRVHGSSPNSNYSQTWIATVPSR